MVIGSPEVLADGRPSIRLESAPLSVCRFGRVTLAVRSWVSSFNKLPNLLLNYFNMFLKRPTPYWPVSGGHNSSFTRWTAGAVWSVAISN